jgi:hypothetical protein
VSVTPQPSSPRQLLRFGVSGHRVPPKLPETSEAPLRSDIDRIFAAATDALRSANEGGAGRCTAVSSLAEGSDRIVAEASLAAGFALRAVLPFNRSEFARDFETVESRREFDHLLARACDIVELNGDATDRPRAYEAANQFMLANVDALIAIWDGEVAAGIGGTAQAVERAIADGIMVIWIEPVHPHLMRVSGGAPAGSLDAAGSLKDRFRVADVAALASMMKDIIDKAKAPQTAAKYEGTTNDATSSPFATSRDRHLFGPGPKRLLAIDGGGVRGALTVAFLERIEAILIERYGPDYRLGDYFDMVGGTSTGAVIAGALALRFKTEQVKHFYMKLAPYAFKRQRWAIPILQAKFDARGLRKQIEDVVGQRLLSSTDLVTGYCVITKRMDTGSPWIISNNPRAPYWEDGKDYIGNKHYPLVNLVRASTAAPHFFDPELLPIVHTETLPDEVAKPLNQPWLARAFHALLQKIGLRKRVKIDTNNYGLFVDGGVTPHNNPALALFQLTTLAPFGIKWPTGPERLTVISLGTGTYRPRLSFEALGFARFAKLAIHAMISMITDSEMLVLTLMQWMGECPAPWQINSEIGTLADVAPPGGKMFRFLRYDVRLEKEWLARELDYKVSDEMIERLRGMDDPTLVDKLYEIGQLAAAKQVKPEHFLG